MTKTQSDDYGTPKVHSLAWHFFGPNLRGLAFWLALLGFIAIQGATR